MQTLSSVQINFIDAGHVSEYICVSISRPYVLKATRTIPINSVTRIVFNLHLLKTKTMFMHPIKDFANNNTFTSVSLFDDSP